MQIGAYLQSHHVWFQPCVARAGAVGEPAGAHAHVSGRHVAKGVLVRAGALFVLAVLPATARIDLERLSARWATRRSRWPTRRSWNRSSATANRGALPPFGGAYGLRTIVDASLAAVSEILCASNTRHEGIRLRYRDYETLEAPLRSLRGADRRETATRRVSASIREVR